MHLHDCLSMLQMIDQDFCNLSMRWAHFKHLNVCGSDSSENQGPFRLTTAATIEQRVLEKAVKNKQTNKKTYFHAELQKKQKQSVQAISLVVFTLLPQNCLKASPSRKNLQPRICLKKKSYQDLFIVSAEKLALLKHKTSNDYMVYASKKFCGLYSSKCLIRPVHYV